MNPVSPSPSGYLRRMNRHSTESSPTAVPTATRTSFVIPPIFDTDSIIFRGNVPVSMAFHTSGPDGSPSPFRSWSLRAPVGMRVLLHESYRPAAHLRLEDHTSELQSH